MLFAAAASLACIMSGCSGNGQQSASINAPLRVEEDGLQQPNSFTIDTDEYGLQRPNFFYSSDNPAFWSIQADIANDIFDSDMRCILRIDVLKPNGILPELGKTFSIESGTSYERFPGNLYVFNGHRSVMKKVEQGILSFTFTSPREVAGTYDVVMTDYDSRLLPVPQYRMAGAFRFVVGTYNSAIPMPDEVIPELGRLAYDALCSACHRLGKYDELGPHALDLSMRGGELPVVYPGSVPEHLSIALDSTRLQALRIFLNAW